MAIGLRCVMMDLCFIQCYETAKHLFGLRWNIDKLRQNNRHIAMFGLLLGNVAPISSIFICKCSFRISFIYSVYIFTISASHSLSSWSHIKQYGEVFSVFWSFCLNWTSKTWIIVRTCTAAFTFAKQSTKGSFRWSRYALMLHKPFWGLGCFCCRQISIFNQNLKFSFGHCFHKKKGNITYSNAIRKEMAKMSYKLDTNLLYDGIFFFNLMDNLLVRTTYRECWDISPHVVVK